MLLTFRCYYEANKESCPAIVKSCLDLIHSDALFLILSNLTGLKLHELADSNAETSSDSETEGRERNQTNGAGNCLNISVKGF